MTIAEFIEAHEITMTSQRVDSNPFMEDDKYKHEMSHWSCTIRCEGRRATVRFSMGSAHRGEPELDSVLSCLAQDAAGYDNARDFADWCGGYGYDTDSRKAERIYRACGQSRQKLVRLLGDDYAELIATEPL